MGLALYGYSIKDIEIYLAVDKKELVNIIEKANELNKNDYTEESWNKFSNALELAIQINENVDAKQYQVDSIVKKLEKTMNQLVKNDGESNPDVTDESLALNKKVISSSNEADGLSGKYITDGDLNSRWGSDWINNTDNSPEYVYVDLEDVYDINKVKIYWDNAFAKNYEIQVCNENPEDENSWIKVLDIDDGNGGEDDIEFNDVNARYVRIYCKEMGLAPFGYSIKDIEIYSDADKKELDKKELVNIIEKANELNKSDYTEDSWNKFSDALESAIQINENVDAKQYELDSIVEELEKIMNQLVNNNEESNPDVTDENLSLDQEVISSSDEADGLSGEYIRDEDLDSRLSSDWINNMDNNQDHVYVDVEDV
ncbi:MAG: discoidin domain-containing protein [Clostridium neonatale]